MSAREIRYDQLDAETAQRVIDTLRPLVTDARYALLESALDTRTRDVVLVLEDLANGHNAAAVLRTAEAFGFFEVHVIEPTLGRFRVSGNVAKGTHKWLDLRWHQQPEATCAALRAEGYEIWASDLHGETVDVSEIDVSGQVAVVFGNEQTGISDVMRAQADRCFRVPMNGFVESLNVSVAAAVTGYDLLTRRRALGRPLGLKPADSQRVLATWLAKSVKAASPVLARDGLPLPVMGRAGLSLE